MINLCPTQLSDLQKVNIRLKNLQVKILIEVKKLDADLLKRVEDKNDPLDDHEIEINIAFCLKENDPNYKEENDNYITRINEYVKGISLNRERDTHFWTGNHNEFTGWNNHIMKDEYHCYWYHCLYDHNNLSFEDILKIGRIYTDIEVYYQYFDEEDI